MDTEYPTHGQKAGFISNLLIFFGGGDKETIHRCPARDVTYIKLLGTLMICTATYLSALFFALGCHLFFRVFWPALLAISIFLACFICLIEMLLVTLPAWFQAGLKTLKTGGLDLDPAIEKKGSLWVGVGVRSGMALSFAQLSALIVGLTLFGGDIQVRIQTDWHRANAQLIAAITTMVDGRIATAGVALEAARKQAEAVSGQVTTVRQNEIDPSANDAEVRRADAEIDRLVGEAGKANDEVGKAQAFSTNELGGIRGSAGNSGHAGNGPVRRAAQERLADARQHAQFIEASLNTARSRLSALRQRLAGDSNAAKEQAKAQLPAFEKRLAEATAGLERMQAQMTPLNDGREAAIRKALEASPDYVPPNDGLLGQLAALDAIAHENPRVAALILIVDVASLCLELGAVASRSLVFVPTTYAGLIARDFYENAVKSVEEMMAGLRPDASKPGPASLAPGERPANDNSRTSLNGLGSIFDGADDQPPEPPQSPTRRGRGRPRKNRLN